MSNMDPVAAFLSLRASAHRLSESAPSTPHLDASSGAPSRDREAERAQVKHLAQEFEAILLNEMLSGWRRSLMSDEEDDTGGFAGLGGFGTMTDMVGTELGRSLSRSGGLGITHLLIGAFDRQLAPTVPTGSNDAAPAGALAPLAAPVTSAFGWRSDPFSGRPTFHAGVDVRLAMGQPVASLADGRVSFAGEQGGYGLTVVVDHPDGLQTRYAHLSSIDVQIGDAVGRGQPLARSGSSGRSTGPHLHVELLRHGRPIDPATLWNPAPATGDGIFKRTGRDADWVA